MKFFAVAALAGAAAAMTGSGVSYITTTVTSLTTYCPGPTTFAYGDKTYTVTAATTLTITDCPEHGCTVVQPSYTKPVTQCSGGYGSGCYSNSTAPVPTAAYHPQGGNDYEPEYETSSGAAANIVALSGAALAGVLAIAVAL